METIYSPNWSCLEIKPVISVLIANYNFGIYLLQAISSALFQSFADSVEIIVVDDGSGTRDKMLLKAAARSCQFPNRQMKVLLLNENIGTCAATNLAFHSSSGQYVLPLCSDDFLFPNYMDEMIQMYYQDKECNLGLVYSLWQGFLGEMKGELMSGKLTITTLKDRNFIPSTTLLKRSAVEKVGCWQEGLLFHSDYDLWLRLTQNYTIKFVPKVLWYYRKHSAQKSKSMNDDSTRHMLLLQHADWVKANWKTRYEGIWETQPGRGGKN